MTTLLLGSLQTPALSAADALNINLAMAIEQRVGNSIWPHWSQTPFPIDLITAAGPIEIGFDKPIPAPSFPPQMEATFPWANGVPTIVIGEPQFTQAKTPVRWSVTLLHEHFHQWQDSWPQYQRSVAALHLAPPNDANSMWMLNYHFPYEQTQVDAAYAAMAQHLVDALTARGSPSFGSAVQSYLGRRNAFKNLLAPADYRYFAFQCWQEGVARYTEFTVANRAAQAHAADRSFLNDTQASELREDAMQTYAHVFAQLRGASLKTNQRVSFYALGAGEALVLDAVVPGWHERYLDPRMDLGNFF